MAFQMKVLTYKNSKFLEDMRNRGLIKEERFSLAKNRAKTLMQDAMEATEDEDMNEDLNDAVDLLEGRPIWELDEGENDEDDDE